MTSMMTKEKKQAEGEDDYNEKNEREEREDALDTALEGLGSDDEMPNPIREHQQQNDADYEEIVYGDTTSFYDKLKEQMGMGGTSQNSKEKSWNT
jgi:RNA polymerase sigma-54 factor